MLRIRGSKARAAFAVAASVAVVAGAVTTASSSAATPSTTKLAPGIASGSHASSHASSHAALTAAAKRSGATPRILANKKLPAGVPNKGNYAFLVKLDARSTMSVFNGARSKGASAARSAASSQLRAVTAAQNKVIAALPSKSKVLYRTHAVISGVAVLTDVHNYGKLAGLAGVSAVYPIAPKSISNSYAVPLQGAPLGWTAYGDLGQNSTVAIIDTGVDYTHANLGGVGTVANYTAAKAQLGQPVSPNEFPGPKVIGGFDLAGDDYDATPTDPTFNPVPAPDPYPLDCNGHGSHVAGTVAGLGENANGSTYTGAYNNSTPFSSMRIGPGMAPAAKLYAFRVFGCEGSSDLVGAAIDMAADPNGDGSTSDHADVINMSLGSDYGSPQDGDSVTSDAASALGISVVVASGNAGDIYDVGGSPGNAPRTIAAAASQDASSVVDALNVTAPAGIAGAYAAERSIAYDYGTKPDLSGTVARVTDPTNLDGCDPLSNADKAAVTGKIAFVEWTDNDTNRRCGSVARSGNLSAAGATGFIFADDEEAFAAGITGSATIPGVLVAKSGGDAIRTELLAAHTVTIGSTTANGFTQLDPSLNDTLAGFSSRGVRGAGDAKPDVTAVGVSVFSTGSGTGNQGLNDSGTSMATPMVAGTAALVRSQHPDWTPEQVKADIMNTADQDLFVGPNHTGDKFAPNRVGAGRIDVKHALDNIVLAYVQDDPGSVSASFGSLAVTAPEVLTKTIKVQNTGTAPVTYNAAYQAATSVPGAVYTVAPSTVTVDPRSSSTVTLTLTLDPSKLTKTIDPTVDATQVGLPREFVADASGLVMFTSAGLPSLRVPVYSAPRPASVMTQPSSITLPNGSEQKALLPLSGQRVNQGSGATAVQSTVAGFELAAVSGAAPACSVTVTSECVSFPDERSADLKYVGVTSDAPQVSSIGGDPSEDGLAYFAITTQGPWRTAASSQEFDILIDTDGDGVADVVVFNTRLATSSDTDVIVVETVDLNTGDVLDAEPIDDRFGDTDIALFDSDTLVMPVAISALGLGATSRITYGVAGFSPYQSAPLDTVGLTDDGDPTGSLSFDPLHPGVAVYGSYDGDASALLFRDSPGSVLAIQRDPAAYALDHGMGALMVHFHNTVGNKAQRLALKSKSTVSIHVTPNPGTHGKKLSAVTTVANTAGIVPTGTVSLQRTVGSKTGIVATGTLHNGTATLSYVPSASGNCVYQVIYAGDTNYNAGKSSAAHIVIK